MNPKQFGAAVVPIVLAEIALGLTHQFLSGDRDNSWFDWALMGISFIVFPFWAGARVARIERSWLWSCTGGICVFAGTVISLAILELFEPALAEMPVVAILGSILVLVPIYALLGFLGGRLAPRNRSYGP